MNTRLLSANLDFDSRLQNVSCYVPDELSVFGRNLVLMSGLVQRTFHVAHSCDENFCFSWSFRCLVNSAGIPSTVFICVSI